MVDRPGHGLSYPIDYRGSDYRRLAHEFIENLLDALELNEADFIANSMGGFFVFAFGIRSPGRIRSSAFVGAPAGLDKYVPPMLRVLALPFVGRMLNRMFSTNNAEVVRTRLYDGTLVKNAERCPTDMLEIGLGFSNRPKQRMAWETLLQRVVSLSGIRDDIFIRDEVASFPVRTMFIWGDADAFAPPESGEELAARMPDARCVVVRDAGHLPWMDQPEEVAALAAEFIGG